MILKIWNEPEYAAWTAEPQEMCIRDRLMLFSVIILFVSFYHSPRIQLIRYNFLLMAVCFFTLSIFYFTFISRTPSFLLRISKLADSYYFWYINLGSNVIFYNVFPFVLIIFCLLYTSRCV